MGIIPSLDDWARRPRRLVGVHNAVGAVLAQDLGFDGVWLSGLEVSASAALPDTEIVTLTETLHICRQISRACPNLPLWVDADTGYGDPFNFSFAATELVRAGVWGVCIEDKMFPKRNSFSNGAQTLADPQDVSDKIKAAKSSVECPQLIARTEALIAGAGVEEALERANRYAEAGADLILIHDKTPSGDDVFAFAQRWHRPELLVAVPTTYYTRDFSELTNSGINTVIYANYSLRSSVQAMRTSMSVIAQEGSTESLEGNISSVNDIFSLQNRNLITSDDVFSVHTTTTDTYLA